MCVNLKAIDILEKVWLKRIELVKKGITPEKTYQRSFLFYDFLYECDKANVKPVTFANFKYKLIYKLEEKHGYSKEDLNIHSKPDATLHKRFGTEMIVYEHNVYFCVAVVVTEKSGIAEALQTQLSNKGILVIDTQGIQSRYAMQIVERYINEGLPVFTTSDYDISGCFMMKRYTDIGAISISLLDIVRNAGLSYEELRQIDKSPKNNHWNSINKEDQLILKNGDGNTYRLELDTIMGKLKSTDFATIFLDMINHYIPIKNVSNIIITPKYPKKLDKLIQKIKKKFGNIYSEDMKNIRSGYTSIDVSLKNLDLLKIEDDAESKSNEYTRDVHIRLIEQLLDDLDLD